MPFIDPTEARIEGLRAAAVITAGRRKGACCCGTADPVIELAGRLSGWLLARPVTIRVGEPTITPPGNPARRLPATRTGADMAVTVKDTDISVTYPAPEALDSKGFEVGDTITLTTDDADGAILAAQPVNDDGSTTFLIGNPGAVQLTWSDGTLTHSDTVNVTPGDAASIVVGDPTVVTGP